MIFVRTCVLFISDDKYSCYEGRTEQKKWGWDFGDQRRGNFAKEQTKWTVSGLGAP